MKKICHNSIAIALVAMGAAVEVAGQTAAVGVSVRDVELERHGGYLSVGMELVLEDLEVESNRAVLLMPRLVNGADSLELPSVGVYGRTRYYYYVRNGESMLTGKDELSYRASEKPDEVAYLQLVPYESWMNGAELALRRSDYGCCGTVLSEEDGALGSYREAFFPELVYVHPRAEASKSRSMEGSAFIDFPVDKTTIYPEYRRNESELNKIRATIDSVRDDRDATITSVWLKGYASPESPYRHNRELAIGRAEALKEYIGRLYQFGDGTISTDYEPENWAGLRRFVEQSGLEHKEGILALIDSIGDPDEREAAIKRAYPEEYSFLLRECYPALRRTDYRVSYEIRSYSDVEEIKRLVREQPQKLSLEEFYLAAQEYEPGSREFSDVFETAVRMYPEDTVANVNAANAAMRRGDLETAERYLKCAGSSAEAVYARGALAIRKGDYEVARSYLEQAQALGLPQATATLDELNRGRR